MQTARLPRLCRWLASSVALRLPCLPWFRARLLGSRGKKSLPSETNRTLP